MNLQTRLRRLRHQVEIELRENILAFHLEKVRDHNFGGFFGRISYDDRVIADAPRGVIQYARLLWSFSEAYFLLGDPVYREAADNAAFWLNTYHADKRYGGYYWTVNRSGEPLDNSKHVYAHAFVIYALSAYARICESEWPLAAAVDTFQLLEMHAYDTQFGGYYEAFWRSWTRRTNINIDEATGRVAKTMNTHLHLLEAYTMLFRLWPNAKLKQRIYHLLKLHCEQIYRPTNAHLGLHFDRDWRVQNQHVSFGHDIEASWLIWEAADVLNDEDQTSSVRTLAIQMAMTTLEQGVDKQGGIINEADNETIIDPNRDWWPQAEALVGFFNAWQLTGDARFLDAVERSWFFIQTTQVDPIYGEWFWGVTPTGTPLPLEKAGLWKTPYHNGRACMELMRRIDCLLTD